MKTLDPPLRPIALHALAATALLLAGLVGPLEAGAFVRSPANPVPLPIAGDEDACQFAILADNNIGEDVWILFSESEMWPRAMFRNKDYFETMSDRRLSPGERLNVRYEVAGRCGATRNWRMVVRIGPRGGEKIGIRRRTNDPSDRTIHLGEAACWAMAGTAPEAVDADRVVEANDEAAGCDPETTRYGMVPAEETDDPAADRPAEEVDVTDRPAEEVDVDQFQGDWVRVESNNPRNNGMRIRVEGGRATITAMPPRGSSRLRVGQVVWDDVSDDGSLAVRGSDGALYPSQLTMEGSNRLQLDIDLDNSPGNDQTWERAGPSIDGDWVLYYTLKAYEQNWGIRVRVEGDRATIRYVPPTADREYRVGDIIWREFSPSDRTSTSLYSFESLFGGSTYEPALMNTSQRYEDGGISSISIRNEADTRPQLWGRPEKAEEVIAKGVGEDEEEGALLDLPREPVGNPSAQDPDLEPSEDLKTVDIPDPIPARSQQSSVLTGVVFNDLNGNGTRDEGEPGLPEVTMVIVRISDEDRSTLTTDADGRFRLEVTGGIQRRISVDASSLPFDGTLTTRFDPYYATIPPGSSSDNADFGFLEEVPAACLASSLPDDRMDVSWGWGLTASTPLSGSANSVLPEYEGASKRYDVVADVERSLVSGLGDHHSYIWQDNVGGRLWEDHVDLTSDGYNALWTQYSDEGFRPTDVEAYQTANGMRYAGVWVSNAEGIDWWSRRNMSDSEYNAVYNDKRANGYRLVDMEGYPTPDGIRYAAIWYKSCDNTDWSQSRNLDEERFQERVTSLLDRDFQVVDFESYRTPAGQRYAAIWERTPTTREWRLQYNDTLEWFLNWHRRYVDEGYRLIDYESYDTAEGRRYAGVWAENDPRYRWAAKAMLDNVIRDYVVQNNLPGISVVIIRDGDVVYRRGDGWADREARKTAHSETVYLTASISKVIGATLAARLEERDLLDLTSRTSDYLGPAIEYISSDSPTAACDETAFASLYPWMCDTLPEDEHTHTVEQLLSKTSCVPHYREGNEPNQSRFYEWRAEALAQIWDDPLLADCTPGEHYRYSTHGFTYVGAVLEAVTGRSIAELLQEEIARPLDLPSMRAMYTSAGSDGFPVNYDRAQAYSLTRTDTARPPPGPNNPTVRAEYSPNASWKVLGGGIESHALDLAQFGWKLLDGQIVSETVRNNRLWTSLTDSAASWVDQSTQPPDTVSKLPGGGVGMAWILGGSMSSTNGRSVRHGGSAVGAGSYLKIWRDRNLVIAMLSNRRDHDNLSRNGLLNRLANIVLASTPP